MREIESILELEPAEFMQTTYRVLLGRDVEDSAVESCVQRVADGVSKIDILREIASSEEAINRAILLGQMERASEEELRGAVNRLNYPSSVHQWLRFEGERFIRACYYVLLGRAPDASGYAYYNELLKQGRRKTRVIYQIARSEESRRIKPSIPGLKNLLFRERLLKVPLIGHVLKKVDLEFLPRSDDDESTAAESMLREEVLAIQNPVLDWSEVPAPLSAMLSSHLDKCAALLISSRNFNEQESVRDALAVVSVRPLDLTGIANFNRRTFVNGDCSVDFFADFGSLHEISSSHCLGDEGDYRYLHIDYLAEAALQRKYKAIIFVLGNSDHNLPVAKAIHKLRYARLRSPVYIHIHDAILLNISRKLARCNGDDFNMISSQLLSKRLGRDCVESSLAVDDSALVREGVTGINYILKDFHVDGMLFNSVAARELFEKDVVGMPSSRMHVLFHPVFDPYDRKARESKENGHIRIGTFGVPGGDKQTLDVCRAFDLFHKKYPNSSFVLAGFHVRDFAEANNLRNGVDGYIIDEPASTNDLLMLMRSCDVAVQLRLSNHGESSGVVPQLLSQDVSVIATEIGAFCAFGDAVRFVKPGISPDEIEKVISSEVFSPIDRSDHRADFVNRHSPKSFMLGFDRILHGGSDTVVETRLSVAGA
ncbi:DUF4214 domain-containing protein [Burkholderia cepacia]|uniref:DUF4214 domain-containing protein n=1 Tax=Burkholderia cepacia TaxID=292 RepID=UPI000F5B2D3D|nr:DUF4214 domain-containing protein [Burkholderia cepacia]RQT60530.1 DUF4214 domain-containing protein [Burkholderia cepacia]